MASPAAADPNAGFAVTVADLASTSAAFARRHDAAAAATAMASTRLAGTAGMGGDDPVLAIWRGRYDAVASITWLATGAMSSSLHGVAVLLVDTANAYLAADHDSTPRGTGTAEQLPRPTDARLLSTGPPPSTGPTPEAGPPDLAEYWPGGDPPRLRAAAAAWNALAGDLDDAAYGADSAFRTLFAHNRGATFSAMAEYWSRRFVPDSFDPLYNAAPRTARILGQISRALADLVEQTRHDVENAAIDAARDTAGAEILARLPARGLPLAGAKLVGTLAPVLVAGGYLSIARDQYLQGLHELTEQLRPDLEGRLRRAVSTELPPDPDPRHDQQVGVRNADVGEILTTGLRGSLWNGMGGPHPDPDRINISQADQIHILDGDAYGGGHRSGAGKPSKSEFPFWWTDRQIIDAVLSVARDPAHRNEAEEGPGPNMAVEGTRNGVLIRVFVGPDGAVATAHPLSGVGVTRNPP